MPSIEWNEKSDRYLSPVQKAAYEAGDAPRRLEGQLIADEGGTVWYYDGHGNARIVGAANRPRAASKRAPEAKPEAKREA